MHSLATASTCASMGPHSFERGDMKPWRLRARTWRPLQWGRTLSSAEISCASSSALVAALLQWGRTLSSAEMKSTGSSRHSAFGLQWGRTLSSAEMLGESRRGFQDDDGFNGAALFRARRCNLLHVLGPRHVRLQWGRTLSSAEMKCTSPRTRLRAGSFNGAALFRARRLRRGGLVHGA